MSVIPCTTRTAKTLVDGTLRLVIDFEPKDKRAAFELFGDEGTPAAIARLTDGAAKKRMVEDFHAETPRKPRQQFTGTMLERAVNLCRDKQFWEFVREDMGMELGESVSESFAAGYVKNHCRVESRKNIDKNPESAKKFGELLELFEAWKKNG